MKIKLVLLWDKYTRLLHWLLALSVLFLVLSGWLMGSLIADVHFWIEWHLIIGQLIIVLLLARAVLFFQAGNSHYSRYKVSIKDSETMKETLKFYLSLARTQLPSWYAINPIWRILYILFYLALIAMVFSGLVDSNTLLFGFYWPSIHESLAAMITGWLALHVLAVFLHDWKSTVNRISAMVSGVAYFEVEEVSKASDTHVIKTTFDLNK